MRDGRCVGEAEDVLCALFCYPCTGTLAEVSYSQLMENNSNKDNDKHNEYRSSSTLNIRAYDDVYSKAYV